MAYYTEEEILEGVAEKVVWWVARRRKKLVDLAHDSHAVNPLLWPILMSMHGFDTFRELAAFQLAGHLVEGHATGFGRLVDEKILPDVFGTTMIDGRYRRANTLFEGHEYDNVDHIVKRKDEPADLLSLKAGRWSIQLGQAVQLNRSFQVLAQAREEGRADFRKIVVGVFYGTYERLTDKYRIVQGLPTRAVHDVVDVSEHVSVLAGREFWSWLNGGEHATQEWVLAGIMLGYERASATHGSVADLFEAFIDDFAAAYAQYQTVDGIDWARLLRDVNG